jgi:hypothetical protein
MVTTAQIRRLPRGIQAWPNHVAQHKGDPASPCGLRGPVDARQCEAAHSPDWHYWSPLGTTSGSNGITPEGEHSKGGPRPLELTGETLPTRGGRTTMFGGVASLVHSTRCGSLFSTGFAGPQVARCG